MCQGDIEPAKDERSAIKAAADRGKVMKGPMRQADESYLLLGMAPPPLSTRCLAQAKLQTWKAGESIEVEGNDINGMFLVCSGLVRLSRILSIGERKSLFLVQPGHFFFEAHLFCKSMVYSQAEAVMDTQTAYFRRNLVNQLVHDGSPFVDNLLYSLSCKALAAGTDVAITAYVDSDERLLHVLRCFADCDALQTDEGRVVKISQADLAELVGMHRVSINRTLKRLERQGLLKTGRSRITLLE